MTERIIEQLKRFKEIEPDPSFTAGSRRTILALSKEPVLVWPNLKLVGALASLVAVVAAGTFLFSGQNASTAFASPEALSQEFKNMNINIELREIEYRQNVSQTIASAITEISSNKLNHLNQEILRSESGEMKLDVPNSDLQIDQLLDEITQ